jgi:hypothetical protein
MKMLSIAVILLAAASAAAQGPVAGQPYLLPPGYQGYAPGTRVVYGGYSYTIQPGGTMLYAPPVAGMPAPPVKPNYPNNNPQVMGSASIQPGYFNPWTGQWSYNTNTTQVYQSAFQPGRNWAMPGTVQNLNQPNPFGGYTTGTTWYDMYGIPHGDVTQFTPNASGGMDQNRVVYSIREGGGQPRQP